MSVVGFALQLAGDVSSFTPLVRTEMQSAIATVAGVHPSSVTVDVTSGSVIVDVRILTPTTTATLVQSAMVSATSTPNSRTSMFASVSGVSVTVLAVVTPPTVSASTPTVTSAPTFTTTDNIRDTGNSLALPLGLGLGLGLGGCLVLSALFVLIKRRKGKVQPAKPEGIPRKELAAEVEPSVVARAFVTPEAVEPTGTK